MSPTATPPEPVSLGQPSLGDAELADLVVPQFEDAGDNYRLSDIAAAIMTVQVGRVADTVVAALSDKETVRT